MPIPGFLQKIGFTPTERKVVYFLVITLFIGIGIRIYQAFSETGHLPQYDYSAMDREFEERSGSQSDSTRTDRSLASDRSFGAKKEPAGLFNINTASPEQLAELPGIGPSLAGRIVEYRDSHGPFQSAEELMSVKGIGEKKFQKLKQHITLQ